MMEPNVTLLIQIINFLIFFYIFKRFLYQPLLAVIRSRQEQINKQRDDAESIKAEALNLKDEYEAKIREARKEAARIVSEAEAEAEWTRSELIAEGKNEAHRLLERARREVEMEKERVAAELRAQSAMLAISIAAKLLEKSLDPKTHQLLVEDFLRRVETGDVA